MKASTLKSVVAATVLAAAFSSSVLVRPARADQLEEWVRKLASEKEDDVQEALRRLAALDDPRAIPALEAMTDDRLRAGPDGRAYVWNSKARDLRDAVSGQLVTPAPRPVREVEMNNDLRRVALPVLAQLQLGSPVASVRLAAAEELSKRGEAQAAQLLHRAVDRERDKGV